MSPRWVIGILCLIFLMMSYPVNSQIAIITTIIKTSLCAVCSSAFILANCAAKENFPCRIIAFKLKFLCRTYPCTNYGAPSQRNCAVPPFGCLPWNIRPLGLCGPFKICCNKGGTVRNTFALTDLLGKERSMLTPGKLWNSAQRSAASLRSDPPTIEPKNVVKNLEQVLVNKNQHVNQTDFYIPTSAQEYMADWVYNQDDPAIVEQAIKYHYDKFMGELNAINKQEVEQGREAVRIPNFEEFRSAAYGVTPV